MRRSLLGDAARNYRLRIVAHDFGSPAQTSDAAQVQVEVYRNLNAPRFERDEYPVSIQQTADVTSTVVQVRAGDSDPREQFGDVKYRVVGDDSAPNFFVVDESSGDVTLQSSLVDDSETTYRVTQRLSNVHPGFVVEVKFNSVVSAAHRSLRQRKSTKK